MGKVGATAVTTGVGFEGGVFAVVERSEGRKEGGREGERAA
jgi:hypothetical protein